MRQITFQKKPFDLLGEVNLKNKKLEFAAHNKKGEIINIADINSKLKVISTFPKLNTSVCDNQTNWISKIAPKYKDVAFISITMDDQETIEKWCLDNNVDNIIILSDKQKKEFGQLTNLLIPKLDMLTRGFIVLDEKNEVIESFYCEELTDDPKFEELEEFIQNNI